MKIFLTTISVLAFLWSCSAADDTPSGEVDIPTPFALGEISVFQEGATATFEVGEPVDNNGIIEIPIEVIGVTNRDRVNVDVTLTLAEGVTRHADDPSDNTATSNKIFLNFSSPFGLNELVSAERGLIVVESNSIRYNLRVNAGYAAQAVIPAPPDVIVTLAGSTPSAFYDGNFGYTVAGLFNGDGVADGSISVGDYAPDGFTIIVGPEVGSSVALADPPGTDAVDFANLTRITVHETAYTNNAQTYTVRGGYAALGSVTPPPASSITVSFPGSTSVIDPTKTELDVSLSGGTYVVGGLTNRSNEDVTFVTNAEFTAPSGYTITPITKTYTVTDEIDASTGLVDLGEFRITDDSITGDTGTPFTIRGIFAEQVKASSPNLVSITFNLAGTLDTTYVTLGNQVLVAGLTNRDNEDITITTDPALFSVPVGFTLTDFSERTIPTPDGNGAVTDDVELGTLTVTEDAYPLNTVTYRFYALPSVFEAQPTAPAPTPDEIVVTLEGSTPTIEYDGALDYTVTGLLNGDADGSISIDNYAPAGFTAVLGSAVLTDPEGTAAVDSAEFTTITVTEDAYPANEVTYTISGGYESRLLGSTPDVATIAAAISLRGSTPSVTYDPNTTTYTVTGLTNREGENVEIDLSGVTVLSGFTLSNDQTSYGDPDGTDAITTSEVFTTFTISEDSVPANAVSYTIVGTFEAQAALPARPAVNSINFTLAGSIPVFIPDGDDNILVAALTNRDNESITITPKAGFALSSADAALFTLSPFSQMSIATPTGNGADSDSTNFTTFTISETAYTDNMREYRLYGSFEAQASIPTETASVFYNSITTSNISPGTSLSLSYVAGQTTALVNASFTDDKFEYFDSANAGLAIGGSGASVTIAYSPSGAGTITVSYTIREKNYESNSEERSYTIDFQ